MFHPAGFRTLCLDRLSCFAGRIPIGVQAEEPAEQEEGFSAWEEIEADTGDAGEMEGVRGFCKSRLGHFFPFRGMFLQLVPAL